MLRIGDAQIPWTPLLELPKSCSVRCPSHAACDEPACLDRPSDHTADTGAGCRCDCRGRARAAAGRRRLGGPADQSQHRLAGPQGLAGPIEDLAKQAMLNGIPLRTAGGIVTHREAQPHPVAQLALQLVFPKPRPMAVTADPPRSTGGWRARPGTRGRATSARSLPPRTRACRPTRPRRRRLRCAAHHRRHRGRPGQADKKSCTLTVCFLPPGLAGVFEVPQHLFFLGIDTDDGIARRHKVLFRDRTSGGPPCSQLRPRLYGTCLARETRYSRYSLDNSTI